MAVAICANARGLALSTECTREVSESRTCHDNEIMMSCKSDGVELSEVVVVVMDKSMAGRIMMFSSYIVT